MVMTKTLETGYDVLKDVEGQPVSGAARTKVLMKGEQMTMVKVTLEAGATLPPHKHKYETVCYVVGGGIHGSAAAPKATVTVGDQTFTVQGGDAFRHPKGVVHSMHTSQGVTILEVNIGPWP